MIAVGIVAFEIGRFSMKQETIAAPALVFMASEKADATTTLEEKGIAARDDASDANLPYAGAKSGKVYYPITCSSLKRVKSENRVYFASVSEAEAAGRTKSSQCK